MSWWYENEEERMKLYKNEDLCIECKNEFFSKPYDHRDPIPGTIGYCIHCDNCLIKDKERAEPKTEQKCLNCKHYATDYCWKNHHVTKNDNKACADFDDTPVKIDRKVYEYYKQKTEQKAEKEDNMWIYEGLPTRQEMGVSDRVVVAIEGYNIVDVGYYDYDLEGWFVEGCRYPVRVYAWHYDKPPRVEE